MSVEKHATDGGTLQLKVQYKYDALDNRIERTEDSDGDGNVDVTERFGYDGSDVWADLNTNNNITYRRLFGPGVDEPVARITAAGTVVWYLTDYQNSVIAMVNSVGSSLGSITYDGFGNILTNTTGVNGDRYGFTSRERDSATGQQYNWARYYDPALGKWTSMDPLGFDAGDANLYRYVGNGPTNGVDPSGMDPPPPVIIGVQETDEPPIAPPKPGATQNTKPGGSIQMKPRPDGGAAATVGGVTIIVIGGHGTSVEVDSTGEITVVEPPPSPHGGGAVLGKPIEMHMKPAPPVGGKPTPGGDGVVVSVGGVPVTVRPPNTVVVLPGGGIEIKPPIDNPPPPPLPDPGRPRLGIPEKK